MSKNVTIVYFCFGLQHLVYTVWSVRSLLKNGFRDIEVVVSTEEERDFFVKHVNEARIPVSVCKGDTGDYPVIGYKAFAFEKYLQSPYFQGKEEDHEIVVCDSDVIWRKNPGVIFEKYRGLNWVQKITPVNPMSYLWKEDEIPEKEIGLITIKNYVMDSGTTINAWPNFRINGGLFMLSKKNISDVIPKFIEKIRSVKPHRMKLSEALLSLTYAELGLVPVTDRRDVIYKFRDKVSNEKRVMNLSDDMTVEYLNKEELGFPHPLIKFSYFDDPNVSSGAEVATHFLSTQKDLLHAEAEKNGLDKDGLIGFVSKEMGRKSRYKPINSFGKLLRRLQNAERY